MKLFVLGATGHTGTHIVDIALSRSHDVTAFVRSPHKIERQHPRLNVVAGNPFDADQLARQVADHDAVLSALGTRPPQAFRPHSVVGECAASTVAAMTKTGVNRIVLVSAAVLFPGTGVAFAFFRWLLQNVSRDLRAAEDILRSSSLDWTIVRPPRLTNGRNSSYRTAREALPAGGNVATFRAVAAFMLDTAENATCIRDVVGLAK
jgi:putative NADH-flavin reductase